MIENVLNLHYGAVHHKINRKYPSIRYQVNRLEYPASLLMYDSSWRGLESIIADLIQRFDIPTGSCLEFGTEYGYSAVALSNYFATVTAVDTFLGDDHVGKHTDNYLEIKEKLKVWKNIRLIQSDYRDFIRDCHDRYDLIHVDILHNYKETYECGMWAAGHSKCAIFHDSESYPEVKQACFEIAKDTGKKFYNYEKYFGLGIIV